MLRAQIDYAYVQEEIIEDEDELERPENAQKSLTMMVMWEFLCELSQALAFVSSRNYPTSFSAHVLSTRPP